MMILKIKTIACTHAALKIPRMASQTYHFILSGAFTHCREREDRMRKAREARQAKIKEREDKQKELELKAQQKVESTNYAQEKKIREDRDRALARYANYIDTLCYYVGCKVYCIYFS